MKQFSPNFISNGLTSCAIHNPDGEIIVCGERVITWSELRVRVNKLAQALIRLGVKKDDKVTFMFHNLPEFFEINYGIQVAGAIPAPMNYRFTPREVEYQANHSDARVFIYDSHWQEAVEPAAPNLKNIQTYICRGKSGLANALDYEEFVNSGAAVDPQVPTTTEDVAVMIYTGGTTGFPKGVMLTYGAHLEMFANLLAGVVVRGAEIELTDEQLEKVSGTLPIPGVKYLNKVTQRKSVKKIMTHPRTNKFLFRIFRRVLADPNLARLGYKNTIRYMTPSMPFFHDASYQILLLGVMVGNISFVLTPEVKFEPAKILSAVEKHKPFFMANVPTGWKKLTSFAEFDKYDVSSMRVAATGAGACSVALKRQIFEKFPGIIIIDMFGQTEMTPITTFRIDTDPNHLKERSVGKSIVEVRVVDENGKDLPRGEVGEILYQSSTVMKGYYKDEEKTQEVKAGGWFKSGDLGYLDEDSEVRLVDRKKECINTGGEKVFPLEVEEILHQHQKVEDVCIIGVPDEEWGSTVRAVVQLKKDASASAEEIIEFCRGQLAGYKIPRSVVFVNELPLSPVGKVLRQKIRDLYGET